MHCSSKQCIYSFFYMMRTKRLLLYIAEDKTHRKNDRARKNTKVGQEISTRRDGFRDGNMTNSALRATSGARWALRDGGFGRDGDDSGDSVVFGTTFFLFDRVPKKCAKGRRTCTVDHLEQVHAR